MQFTRNARVFVARFAAVAAIFGAFVQALDAATLDVELSVSHGFYSEGELSPSRNVVYLVIDRSGSMAEHTLPGGRTPDEALLESLKMQLDAIPSGAEVHVFPFSGKIWEAATFKNLDDAARQLILKRVKEMKPNGQTVLYDVQDVALTAAAKVMDEDANAEVRVLVYTDGIHQVPWDGYTGEYRACSHRPKKAMLAFGKKRWEENPSYREELAAARKKFEDKFSGLMAKPNLEVEYEWLSASSKPEPGMHTKTPITPEFASHTPELYNPLENPSQAFKGALHLPISDRCWEDVKGKEFTVEWMVGGKKASGTLTLDSGRQKCSIEWPSLPEDNPEPAALAVKGLPQGRKFVLLNPKPVNYTIPALKRAEVAIVSPAEGAVFVVGDKVKFEAKSSEASATWKLPSGSEEGLSFEKVFDQEGAVRLAVTAGRGVRATTVSRTFEVIRTGVELKGSANGYYEVGQTAAFTAKAVGQALGYAWTVDGQPVAGDAASFNHVFTDTKSHEVGVTARYKKDITASAKCVARVWSKPFISIEAPEDFDGNAESSVLRVGKPVALKAKVEGAFSSATWLFEQNGKVVATVPVAVKDGFASGSYVPTKGGLCDITVVAEGLAGKIKEEVQIYVKP